MTQFNGNNPLEFLAKAIEQGLQGNPFIEIIGDENHPFIKELKKKAAEQQGSLKDFLEKAQQSDGGAFDEAVEQLKGFMNFGETAPETSNAKEKVEKVIPSDLAHLSLEDIEEQVRFWTELKELKVESLRKENVVKKQKEDLAKQIAAYQKDLDGLNRELPSLMVTDMGKAQDYFYRMATISNTIAKLKEQLAQLEG